jgi:hypothetical protein
MILVILGGRQNCFASLSISGRKKRGYQKQKLAKNMFFEKNDSNLADCKIFAFCFFLIKQKNSCRKCF